MRDPKPPELHAAATALQNRSLPFKQHALLFDQIHLVGSAESTVPKSLSKEEAEVALADLEFLQEHKVIEFIEPRDIVKLIVSAQTTDDQKKEHLKLLSDVAVERVKNTFPLLFGKSHMTKPFATVGDPKNVDWENPRMAATSQRKLSDYYTRLMAIGLSRTSQIETVPLCWNAVPSALPPAVQDPSNTLQDVLNITFEYFPVPDDTCAWEDILQFREDRKQNKLWDFRHFLTTLATQPQSEKQIRTAIEYALHEYTGAMKRHHMKAKNSFMEVYIVTPVELLGKILKLEWSDILKGGMGARKRKAELMEAEATAPGRECAYVFDARKRFGKA